MLKRNKIAIAFILNLAIVIMEVISLGISFTNHGATLIQYYTEDSNIFTMVSCLAFCIYVGLNFKKGKVEVPQWIHMARFMSTCCLAVTFIVVITVLAPTAGPHGYRMMLLEDSMLFHHFLCPVIAAISFIFFEKEPILSKKHCGYAMIPTFIYAVIVITLNIFHVIVGPYPFLHIYEQPLYMTLIWVVVIIGGAYLITRVFRWLNLKLNK